MVKKLVNISTIFSNKFVSKKGEVKSGNLCLQIIGYQVGYNDYKIYQFVAIWFLNNAFMRSNNRMEKGLYEYLRVPTYLSF